MFNCKLKEVWFALTLMEYGSLLSHFLKLLNLLNSRKHGIFSFFPNTHYFLFGFLQSNFIFVFFFYVLLIKKILFLELELFSLAFFWIWSSSRFCVPSEIRSDSYPEYMTVNEFFSENILMWFSLIKSKCVLGLDEGRVRT